MGPEVKEGVEAQEAAVPAVAPVVVPEGAEVPVVAVVPEAVPVEIDKA